MSEFALNSSALLAIFNLEPGADVVRPLLGEALLSAVNLAEVASKFVERNHDLSDLSAFLAEAQIEIVPFTASQARLAGELRRAARPRGLSLGDRACLALAQERGLTAVTADSAWVVATPLPVRLIR